MKYTTLGPTGLVVSRLAFGAMTFGQGRLIRTLKNDIDQQTATRMVHTALGAGVNLFDTADAYTGGQSEIMLGAAIGEKRNSAIIVTKVGYRTGETLTDAGLSYRRVIAAAEASLRRLATDYIDIYLLHIQDPLTPIEETARACEELIKRGLVRYVGYSNYPAWKAQKLLDLQDRNRWRKIALAQVYYSLLGRDIEFETASFVRDSGLGLMVGAPLASGFLSGKYTRQNPAPPDARRSKTSFPPIEIEKAYDTVEVLKEIAAVHRASPAQIAIAWLLGRSFVSSIIIGANKHEQLEDNLRAVDVELSQGEIQALDKITDPQLPYPYWSELSGRDNDVWEALNTR